MRLVIDYWNWTHDWHGPRHGEISRQTCITSHKTSNFPVFHFWFPHITSSSCIITPSLPPIQPHLCELHIGRIPQDGAIGHLVACIPDQLSIPHTEIRLGLGTVGKDGNGRPVGRDALKTVTHSYWLVLLIIITKGLTTPYRTHDLMVFYCDWHLMVMYTTTTTHHGPIPLLLSMPIV